MQHLVSSNDNHLSYLLLFFLNRGFSRPPFPKAAKKGHFSDTLSYPWLLTYLGSPITCCWRSCPKLTRLCSRCVMPYGLVPICFWRMIHDRVVRMFDTTVGGGDARGFRPAFEADIQSMKHIEGILLAGYPRYNRHLLCCWPVQLSLCCASLHWHDNGMACQRLSTLLPVHGDMFSCLFHTKINTPVYWLVSDLWLEVINVFFYNVPLYHRYNIDPISADWTRPFRIAQNHKRRFCLIPQSKSSTDITFFINNVKCSTEIKESQYRATTIIDSLKYIFMHWK